MSRIAGIAHLRAVIVIVVGMLALDAAIGLVAHGAFAMSFTKPTVALWEPDRRG